MTLNQSLFSYFENYKKLSNSRTNDSIFIAPMPKNYLKYIISDILPFLKISEKYANTRTSSEDILDSLFKEQIILWVIIKDQKICGQYITEVCHYDKAKMLVIDYCAIEPFLFKNEISTYMVDQIENYARQLNCNGIEFVGRMGWTPFAKKFGFVQKSIVFEKFLG